MPGPLLEKEAECACVLASRGVEIAVIARSLNVDEEAVAQAVSPRRCAEITNILPDTRVELVWSAGLAGRHLGLAPAPDQHPLRGGDALALRQVYHGSRVIGKGAFGPSLQSKQHHTVFLLQMLHFWRPSLPPL